MWKSSRCEMLDTLTTLWESFQVGRALSLSTNDRKPRPMEESMELNSCLFIKGGCVRVDWNAFGYRRERSPGGPLIIYTSFPLDCWGCWFGVALPIKLLSDYENPEGGLLRD